MISLNEQLSAKIFTLQQVEQSAQAAILHGIVQLAAAEWSVSPHQLLSRERGRTIDDARHAAVYFCMAAIDEPKVVAKFFGRTPESLIISRNVAADLITVDAKYASKMTKLGVVLRELLGTMLKGAA